MKPSDKKYKTEKCHCPYCEEELKMSCFEPPFCVLCKIKFEKCKNCGAWSPAGTRFCGECGTKIE